MKAKEIILQLKDGEKIDYNSSIEIWRIHDYLFVYEMPYGGGDMMLVRTSKICIIDELLNTINSWC